MSITKGIVCKDKLTKVLIQRIKKNNIAVIKHKSIDLVAAQDLKYKGVKAVVNCEKTIDKEQNLDGIVYLLENGIKIFDVYDMNFFDIVHDGDLLHICSGYVLANGMVFDCFEVTYESVLYSLNNRIQKEQKNKYDFMKNTLDYMNNELNYFIFDKAIPDLGTELEGKDVLIIARGRGYREDLMAVRSFIKHKKPIIIGVDGGADAVIDAGLKNDIIIGDMDSVSDESLLNCNEILIHAYSSGYAPGEDRIKSMGLKYGVIPIKGTSEDAAIYMAKLKGASKIYLIGSHISVEEFMEKGRSGMGSTALLRILFGSSIIDLKGISNVEKYNNKNYSRISIFCIILTLVISAVMLYNSLLLDTLRVLLNVR